jgi:hypothetical protein
MMMMMIKIVKIIDSNSEEGYHESRKCRSTTEKFGHVMYLETQF